MSAIVKKCCFCRAPLENNRSASCERCQKNEKRYGKPSTCTICTLPAAFRDSKCVYCASLERKHGSPVNCVKCMLKTAFAYNGKREANHLCRMCQITARAAGETSVAGVKVPPEKGKSSEHKEKHKDGENRKRKRPHDENNKTSSTTNSHRRTAQSDNDSVLEIQRLRDVIAKQEISINEKDATIKENGMRIAALQVELMTQERKNREKIERMCKEKDDAINAVHEKYRQAAKQSKEKK